MVGKEHYANLSNVHNTKPGFFKYQLPTLIVTYKKCWNLQGIFTTRTFLIRFMKPEQAGFVFLYQVELESSY